MTFIFWEQIRGPAYVSQTTMARVHIGGTACRYWDYSTFDLNPPSGPQPRQGTGQSRRLRQQPAADSLRRLHVRPGLEAEIAVQQLAEPGGNGGESVQGAGVAV